MYSPIPPGAFKRNPPVILNRFRGVNKLDSFFISLEHLSDMKNMSTRDFPALSTRPGFTQIGSTLGGKILGLGVYKDAELHAISDNGTWYRYSGGSWVAIKTGLSTSATAYFTNFRGAFSDINLIMSNGIDSVMRWDGNSVQNVTNAPANANYVTTYQNRLWVAKGNEILASALDNATDWTPVAGNESKGYGKDIESPIGEIINGLYGDLYNLTISFPKSIRKLLGGVPSDFNDQNVSQSIGIVNNKSAVTIDGTMYMLSKSGLYYYGGGISPDKKGYSEIVQYYIDHANTTGLSQSVAGSDGNNLYFAIPSDSSTAPDTILEYDPRRDVRAWNVWKDITALHMVQMGSDFYIGDASGRVLKLGGSDDAGTAISWHAVSKAFTAPSMSQTIRFLSMWITVDLPTGSTMTVSLSGSKDGEDWTEVGTVTATTDLQRKRIPVRSTAIANKQQLRFKIAGTGPATIHEITFEPVYMNLV